MRVTFGWLSDTFYEKQCHVLLAKNFLRSLKRTIFGDCRKREIGVVLLLYRE